MRLFDALTRAALNLVDPYVHAEAPRPEPRVWPYIRSHLRPLRLVLVLSVLATILAASLEVWLIGYAGRLIDLLADTPPSELWATHGTGLTVALLVIVAGRPMAQFARHAINDIGLDCNIANLVRFRAHDHLTRQSVGWFQEDLAGKTASRLVLMGNYAADVIYNSLNVVAFGAVYLVGIVTLMGGADLRLAIPLLLWLGLYAGVMVWIVPRLVAAMERFMEAKSGLLGKVVDTFSNFDTMSLFARRADLETDHRVSLEEVRGRLFEARRINVAMRTLTVLLEGVIMAGFVGYGVWLWSQGAASIGLVSAAVALSLRITSMADAVMEAVWRIFQQVGSVREALQTLGQPLDMPGAADAPALEVTRGALSIEEVRHRYGGGRGGVDGVTLHVAPGERVGLVGPSGAGKSTLVNLVLRFHDLEPGRIAIDGQDLARVDPESLRRAIGMVSQQAALLNRSVRANIALGRPDVGDAEIEAAARRARAHGFIEGLTDAAGRTGYDAHVGERGVKLSGGQRQRIALARVVLKDAPILILDEATSALDSETEARIQSALEAVMEGKTVIAVAHRLSTVAGMDRIVVMEGGRIAEEGTHAALLARGGLYAGLWAHQSGA